MHETSTHALWILRMGTSNLQCGIKYYFSEKPTPKSMAEKYHQDPKKF